MLPFKKGGFIMALRPGAHRAGGHRRRRAAMHKGSKLVWPTRVHIAIGVPIETRGRTLQERDRLIAETRDRIAAMLPS